MVRNTLQIFNIDELSLLRGADIPINEHIKLKNPTLSEIEHVGEAKYFAVIHSLTVNPSSLKSILFYEFNIDYTEITDYELFLMMFATYQDIDKEVFSILIEGFFFDDFTLVNNQNGDTVLFHKKEHWVIDEIIYKKIVDGLRQIHHLEENIELPGNEHAKKFLIDRDRRRLMREKKKKYKPYLSGLIKNLVNCNHFKYNFDTIWDLNIYAFFESINAINKLQNYNFVMTGAYSGMVEVKQSTIDKAYWLSRD